MIYENINRKVSIKKEANFKGTIHLKVEKSYKI